MISKTPLSASSLADGSILLWPQCVEPMSPYSILVIVRYSSPACRSSPPVASGQVSHSDYTVAVDGSRPGCALLVSETQFAQ